ncbi:MAG: GNAT family N-acetyltransferase [Candidatus Nanopelagicales bacterium]|nr:GNAT family N-acetyltransferase [Candidatus Nanopelagicales bacterium]
MSARVVHAAEQSRYEIWLGEELAGYAEYEQAGDVVRLTATRIYDEFERRGLGSALAEGLVVDVRNRGQRVLPVCPFMVWWVAEHPECGDIVEPDGPEDD